MFAASIVIVRQDDYPLAGEVNRVGLLPSAMRAIEVRGNRNLAVGREDGFQVVGVLLALADKDLRGGQHVLEVVKRLGDALQVVDPATLPIRSAQAESLTG